MLGFVLQASCVVMSDHVLFVKAFGRTNNTNFSSLAKSRFPFHVISFILLFAVVLIFGVCLLCLTCGESFGHVWRPAAKSVVSTSALSVQCRAIMYLSCHLIIVFAFVAARCALRVPCTCAACRYLVGLSFGLLFVRYACLCSFACVVWLHDPFFGCALRSAPMRVRYWGGLPSQIRTNNALWSR